MRRSEGIMVPQLVFLAFLIVCMCHTSVLGASLEFAKVLDDRAEALYRRGHYSAAIVYAEKALTIYREILGEKHLDTATSYNNLGMLYESIGDYEKAEPFLNKALGIHEELLGEKHPDTAASYNNLGMLYESMGDYTKAETLLKKALATCNEILGERHPDTAQSYNNLGMLYKSKGDYAKVEILFKKALAINKVALGEEHPNTAKYYNNLGMFYKFMGDFEKAEPFLSKALAIHKEVLGENHPHTAGGYNNLGMFYKSMGDFEKAEPFLNKALAIHKEVLGEKHPHTAGCYTNLAELHTDMGYYVKAELLYQKALMIDRETLGEKHPNTAQDFNNLGALYEILGKYAHAKTLYQQALTIRKEVLGERHLDTAQSYNNFGLLYKSMGDYARAEKSYHSALAIAKKLLGERHPHTIGCYKNLGVLYVEKGEIGRAKAIFNEHNSASGMGRCHLAEMDYLKARNEFRTALSRSERGGKREFIIGDCVGLGLALEGLEDYKGAETQFRRAISIIEPQRSELSGSTRETFMGGKVGAGFSRMDAYEGMIRVIWKEKKAGYEAEALRYCERVKSRMLLEMLATRRVKGRDAADEKIMARDREFQWQLASLRKLVRTLDDLGDKAPRGRLGEARKELEQSEAAYETFIKDVKLKNAELASLITVDVPAPSKIQSYLDDDTTLLEYFTGKDNTYAWLMARDRIRMYEIPEGKKMVSNMVNTLLLANISKRLRRPEPMIILAPGESKKTTEAERKKNRETFLRGTKAIHQALIAPVAGDIKTRRLIVAPHGALHKVPFGSLTDGHRCLVENYALTVVPSASVIPQVASKRKAKSGALLAMGNPQTDYVPLGFAEAEVNQISQFFPMKRVYLKDKATEEQLKKEATGAGVIHLACHGEFHDHQPLQSGLLLASGGGNDGRLQVHEIFGMDLRNASLVTLSACETALGTISSGDDMVGLSRAFIYAGTPSLIASLWEVDDESTGILMTRFYDNWRNKGMNKPEALRQAQLSLKAMPRYRHPYHWAAFVLIGDWM